jgi:hypothetical protein
MPSRRMSEDARVSRWRLVGFALVYGVVVAAGTIAGSRPLFRRPARTLREARSR